MKHRIGQLKKVGGRTGIARVEGSTKAAHESIHESSRL